MVKVLLGLLFADIFVPILITSPYFDLDKMLSNSEFLSRPFSTSSVKSKNDLKF